MRLDSNGNSDGVLPDSNTGVLPTITQDYLAFTIENSFENMEYLKGVFDNMSFEELGYGGMGYQKSAVLGDGGRVFWHPERLDMGLHVRLGAKALSQVLTTPVGLLNIVIGRGGKITRLDVAFDDFDGALDIDKMYQKLILGEVTTRWRRVARIEGQNMGGEDKTGCTVNVGSRVSEGFLRIYDKLLEQRARKKDTGDLAHWVRVELELKGDKADVFGRILAATATGETKTTPGELCAELLLGLIDFKEASEGETNKSRWKTSLWWGEFVHTAKKLKLSIPKDKKTLQDSKDWIEKSVSSTLSMIILSRDDDQGQSGYEFIMSCIEKGEGKMSKEQWLKLSLFNSEQEAKKAPT